MPQVHDSADKRQYFYSEEVFNVNNGCWEQRTTRGTPPLVVRAIPVSVLSGTKVLMPQVDHASLL